MTRLDEQLLLSRIYQHQDEDAFRSIYFDYSPRIKKFLLFKLPSETDADDILSEVFIRAWKYSTTVKVEKMNALLYKISRNCIADFYRTRPDWQVTLTEEIEVTVGDKGDAAGQIEMASEIILLKPFIKELKESYQELIELHYLHSLPVSEIAIIINKTENNVRVGLHRATQSLKKLMENK